MRGRATVLIAHLRNSSAICVRLLNGRTIRAVTDPFTQRPNRNLPDDLSKHTGTLGHSRGEDEYFRGSTP